MAQNSDFIFDTEKQAPVFDMSVFKNAEGEKTTEEGGPELKGAAAIVTINKDLLTAVLRIMSPEPGGADITERDVIDEIQSKNICYGLLQQEVKSAVLDKIYNRDVLIAAGDQVVNGSDAIIKFVTQITARKAPKQNEDGSVDFFQLELFHSVEKGQVIAEKTPASEGVPGKSVIGTTLSQLAGKDKPFPAGINTVISEDGLRLVATMSGRIQENAGRINVLNVFEVNGDIDISTGNIIFDGNVIVKGSIRHGYSLEASGNVDIFGAIDKATVIAGGDIAVKGGIIGNIANPHECKVFGKGNVTCLYIENTSVSAADNISSQAIINSEIRCGGEVIIEGKGSILGGRIIAAKNIMIKSSGSQAYVETSFEAGTDPTLADRENELTNELIGTEKAMNDVVRLETLLIQLQKLGRLDEEKTETLENLSYTRQVNENRMNLIKEDLVKVKQKRWSRNDSEISISGKIWPGTIITIGQAMFRVEELMISKTFKQVEDEIVY